MALSLKTHKLVAVVVFIAAAVWIGTGKFASVGSEEANAAQPKSEQAPAPAPSLRTVAVVTPRFSDHAREIRLSGVTGADKRAVLAARSSGVISMLEITKGDIVSADQIVLSLEGADVAAAVTTAQATLAQRTQELEVAEKLFATGNTAELQLVGVRAAKAAAEAQLSQAEAAADRLNLRVPFTGVVDSVDAELGEWVQGGAPIATVLALDPIVVRAEVSELDVGYVNVGDKATVRLVNGEKMDGTVRYVAREASDLTRTFPVEVALPNADRAIPAGMTSNVSLFVKPVRSVIVPRSIITLSETGELGLRVIGPDNIARFASVVLIDDTPEGMVLTGVPADVRIVVSGQDLVRDGEKVSVAADPASIGAEAEK
jgi:multidrug efflux system membrane fusion protein